MDALSEALARIDPKALKLQLNTYVPSDAQKILAAAGVRDEHVFPTPIVLESKPTLVGYYRLLLGVPQKSFYGTGTGMGQFKSMEARGVIHARQQALLPAFCDAMSGGLADLVRQMSPAITRRDISELPLLTVGAQFQDSNNNVIGRQAIMDVFLSIHEMGACPCRASLKNTLNAVAGLSLPGPDPRCAFFGTVLYLCLEAR